MHIDFMRIVVRGPCSVNRECGRPEIVWAPFYNGIFHFERFEIRHSGGKG